MGDTHHFPDGLQIREQVSMTHKLCDKTQWLLHRHTANKVNNMRIVGLSNLFHCVNLVQEVVPLTTSCRVWRGMAVGGLIERKHLSIVH